MLQTARANCVPGIKRYIRKKIRHPKFILRLSIQAGKKAISARKYIEGRSIHIRDAYRILQENKIKNQIPAHQQRSQLHGKGMGGDKTCGWHSLPVLSKAAERMVKLFQISWIQILRKVKKSNYERAQKLLNRTYRKISVCLDRHPPWFSKAHLCLTTFAAILLLQAKFWLARWQAVWDIPKLCEAELLARWCIHMRTMKIRTSMPPYFLLEKN